MDNISKAVPTPVQSPVVSDMASLLLAAQAQVAQSQIIHSAIGHSPIVQTKIAQSPVAQPKIFQPDLPESEFLNLSFDQLSQVAVRASRSNQIQTQIQTKEALEVKSQENFLEMPLERLIRLPVRLATLGKNDKDKELKNAEEVTSNPTSINFQAIPVFSTQALQSVTSYNTNLENTSTNTNNTTDNDGSTTNNTSTTNTSTVTPLPNNSNVIPIPVILPQFLTITNYGSSYVSTLIRQSDGSFSPQMISPVAGAPWGVASADLNRDGILDLVVTTNSPDGVAVLLGTAVGTFAPATNYIAGTTPRGVAIGDFNGDGIPDIAVTNLPFTNVSILLGTGTGTFGTATNFALGGSGAANIAIGDFNGDGISDLVIVEYTSNTISVLFGTGTGSFGSLNTFVSGGNNPIAVAVADFNRDGILDLAVVNEGSDTISIRLGNGMGSFGGFTNYAVGSLPFGIAIGDFNGDGILDLAVSNSSSLANTVSILLGTGTGAFGSATNFPVGNDPLGIVTGDFNRDGKLDLAVTSLSSDMVSTLFGNGDGSFQSPVSYPVGTSPTNIAIGFIPAGVSGSPINLALGGAILESYDIVEITISDVPIDWSLNAGVNNLNGSWTIQTRNPELLTITTSDDFVGARALTVDMSWLSANGKIEHVYFKNNIEAYASDSAIFALPNDNLTGSSRADIFVITKSSELVQDKIFNFDTKLDQIDLVNFKTVHDFSDLIIENDTYGNALIQLLDNNQSILLSGIDAHEITDKNFLFNIMPHTINNGIIDIGVGSIMPFNGIFENNGIVYVEGILRVEGDITGVGKIILASSGTLELEGHLGQDIIFETSNITLPILEANQIA